jgi:8-oxo-dGTP diphosphatase
MGDRPDAFYESLPAKRMAAGVLFRDGEGRVLLVEPVYKERWEVPGGIVEMNESPRAAAQREVQEELGLERSMGRLWCVDWHSADPPATEAVVLLFDGGHLGEDEAAAFRLPPAELRSWAFCALDEAKGRLSPRLFRRIASCLASPDQTLYLEDGVVLPST